MLPVGDSATGKWRTSPGRSASRSPARAGRSVKSVRLDICVSISTSGPGAMPPIRTVPSAAVSSRRSAAPTMKRPPETPSSEAPRTPSPSSSTNISAMIAPLRAIPAGVVRQRLGPRHRPSVNPMPARQPSPSRPAEALSPSGPNCWLKVAPPPIVPLSACQSRSSARLPAPSLRAALRLAPSIRQPFRSEAVIPLRSRQSPRPAVTPSAAVPCHGALPSRTAPSARFACQSAIGSTIRAAAM